jgi:RND family efflux transporter MFP subunit
MIFRRALLLIAAVTIAACGANDDSDHAQAPGKGDSWAVTAWGQHFELFPEFDALIAGETAGAHVHVTVLEGFTPATEGLVTVVLTDAGGTKERFASATAIRPGIFNVEIQPDAAGDRELSFEIEVGGVAETIPGGTVRVGGADYPGGLVRSPHTLPAGDGGEVMDFLKEQQWRTRFATSWAVEDAQKSSVSGMSRVEPPAGGDVSLTAPVDGVVRATVWPYTGQTVAAGEILVTLIPSVPSQRSLADLEASVYELEALSEAAVARLGRLESLLARGAVSRREVEQARAEATGLQARLEAVQAELAGAEAAREGRGGVPGFGIKAPFAGRVAEVLVSPGEHVNAGTTLLRAVRERPVWIRVAMIPEDSALLEDGIAGLILDTGATSVPVDVSAEDVRLIAVAPEVDPGSGTVDALIEVRRSVDELKPGIRATAQILLPGEIEGVVLPESAVIDDAGVPVVYVQLSGESFSRREVAVRHRQGQRVVVDGVSPGERVVTVGGAAIRRASLLASGSVEGHVH